jgi:hypothetical protein
MTTATGDLGGLRFRLGFVVARLDVTLPWLPLRWYRGIDRVPQAPLYAGIPTNVASFWTRYLDAWDDGSLSCDLDVAREAKDNLDKAAHPVEILFAEATVVPSSAATQISQGAAQYRSELFKWLEFWSARVPVAPSEFVVLGYDVSTPIPDYHSALLRPGGAAQPSDLLDRLNEHGLVTDPGDATELAHAANLSWGSVGLISVIRLLCEAGNR